MVWRGLLYFHCVAPYPLWYKRLAADLFGPWCFLELFTSFYYIHVNINCIEINELQHQ